MTQRNSLDVEKGIVEPEASGEIKAETPTLFGSMTGSLTNLFKRAPSLKTLSPRKEGKEAQAGERNGLLEEEPKPTGVLSRVFGGF